MSFYASLFADLQREGVRFVIVGGVAVVLHGFPRLTHDLDLVIDLEPAAVKHAIEVFGALGFRPRLPVDPMGFADEETRRTWIEEKSMAFFSYWDPQNLVDLFAENPFPFEELWQRAKVVLLGDLSVRIASVDDMIEMKKRAGRPHDLQDIEALDHLRTT